VLLVRCSWRPSCWLDICQSTYISFVLLFESPCALACRVPFLSAVFIVVVNSLLYVGRFGNSVVKNGGMFLMYSSTVVAFCISGGVMCRNWCELYASLNVPPFILVTLVCSIPSCSFFASWVV
jgi:hypothetical protein